jgi:hypothetical protein
MLHSGFAPLSRSSLAGESYTRHQHTNQKYERKGLPREEVSQMHELAVTLVLDIDNAPTVLATTDRLAVNNHVAFGTNDSERNNVLGRIRVRTTLEGTRSYRDTYPD